MVIREQWVKTMTDALVLKHPGVPRDKIRKQVDDIFEKKFRDTKCQIYDNYNESIYDITLAGTLDWIKQKNPLICESGVFFHQKSECRSLQTEIIKECMLDARDIHKGEKFKAMEAGDTVTAGIKDIQQSNDKKAANSGYGAEGEKSSFLFNLHSAMSVTAAGRGQLSTALQSVENYFADNVKFFAEDDFMVHILNIIGERNDWKFLTDDYIPEVPTKEQFISRFVGKFRSPRKAPVKSIERVYESLDDEMRKRAFYKCYMRAFLMLPKIRKILEDIAHTSVQFIDPNKIVPELAENVGRLQDLAVEFVNYKHSVYKYEDRSKSLPRAVITTADTDSVFVNCNPLLQFVIGTVLQDGEKLKEKGDTFEMRMMNVIVCLADVGIKDTLANYLGTVNVPMSDRKFVLMKNEFHYSTIVTTFAMKSYFGLQLRQEKVMLNPPKLDVKGVNFFKSTSSKHTTDFIYDDILMGEILKPKDGKIKIKRILSKIHRYEDEMADRIKAGDMGYLKTSIRVKSSDGYARPMSIGQYKAVYVWNKICEQKDLIELPGTVTLVKVKIRKKEDIVPLADYPGMFEKFSALFEDPNLLKARETSKGTVYDFTGIKSIALPGTFDEVPEWLLSIIDVETLIQDNMKLFVQLYSPLGLTKGRSSHNGATMSYYTNIIRI